jgi:GNAT superfamily N-acetyltransferase
MVIMELSQPLSIDGKEIMIRKINPDDSISELTKVLNAAYRQLADMGLMYVATWQDDEITRKRIKDTVCWVATDGEKIIGTISYRESKLASGCDWYDQKGVASFGQFGILPDYQKHGIGSAMLDIVERWAKETGADEIACDTAEPATHLRAMYEKRGYRFIQFQDWEVTNYRSVILSKNLYDPD